MFALSIVLCVIEFILGLLSLISFTHVGWTYFFAIAILICTIISAVLLFKSIPEIRYAYSPGFAISTTVLFGSAVGIGILFLIISIILIFGAHSIADAMSSDLATLLQ